MTAELLDRLLYTDCKPGTGRGAGGGFQVQAQSSGVDSAQSKLAVAWLLYEVQLPWINQRRAVEEFPMGLAHTAAEGYGTAQSRYLGKVATGGRDGNHLADCLLTRDPHLYGPVRPAQLWRSGLWRAEPWDSKDCPQFSAADLEPGPFSVEAVADWLRAAPERGPTLARMLSVLEDPDGKRVVIAADDPEQAVIWIAAATLLLPSRLALGISFKVFSSAPLDAKHRIVATPADLFPKIAPGLVSQRWVLDARTGAADEAETSERAAFFGGRFAGGEDPYDVVDAVELADALGGGRDAMLTAWTLTRPDDPRPEPDALSRWLTGARPELLGEHGPAVAAMVLEADPSAAVLGWVDAAVADKRLDVDPASVRVQLLRAELAEIRDGRGAPPADVLPVARLDASSRRDAESELSSALLLGDDHQADLLLRLARRHRVEPELSAPLVQRLRDFARGWIGHPSGYHPDAWALHAKVLDYAHDALRERMNRDNAASVSRVVRQVNRYFSDRADLSEALDCDIQASLLAGAWPERLDRVGRLRQLLDSITHLTRSPALAHTAPTAAAGLQRALLRWNAVDGDIAVTVLTHLPDTLAVEPVIADYAAERLTQMSERPSRGLLDLLASLDKQGRTPPSRPLVKLLQADRHVRTFTRRAREDRLLVDPVYFDRAITTLREAGTAVLRARVDNVLAACLESPHPDLGAAVLSYLKAPVPGLLVERWAATLGRRDPVSDGLWCVRCLEHDKLPPKLGEQLQAAVSDYARRLSPQDRDRWYGEVKRRLPSELHAAWDSTFAQEAPRARPRLWISRGGSS